MSDDKLRAIRQWVQDGREMANRPDTMEDWDNDPDWHRRYFHHQTHDTPDWVRFLLEEYDRLEHELAMTNAKIESALAVPVNWVNAISIAHAQGYHTGVAMVQHYLRDESE